MAFTLAPFLGLAPFLAAGMSDDPQNHQTGISFVTWGILLAVAYPLSLGPAVWILERTGMPDWIVIPFQVFYWPLELLAGYSPAFKDLARGYVQLWR